MRLVEGAETGGGHRAPPPRWRPSIIEHAWTRRTLPAHPPKPKAESGLNVRAHRGLEGGQMVVMLRQCCAPAFNRAKPNSTRRNDTQLDSKLSASLASNHLDSFGLLGLVSILNPRSHALRLSPSKVMSDHKSLDVLRPDPDEVQDAPIG